MWEISNSGQLLSFFVSFLFGLGYGLFYTLFKAVRKAFRHGVFSVFLEDVVFSFIVAIITFLLFLAFSNGEIRFFMLIAIFFGFSAFYFTASNFLSRVIARILRFVFRVFSKAWRLLSVGLDIFFKTIAKTALYCGKKLRILSKCLKKPLKEGAQMVYTKEND